MKSMKAMFSILMLTAVLGTTGISAIAIAQQAAPAVSASPAAASAEVKSEAASAAVAAQPAAAPSEEKSLSDVMKEFVKVFEDWKKLGWQAGLAALLMCLVSTMKNSMLRQMIWSKIPDWAKITVAPLLSILAFGLAMGKDFSGAAFWAAVTTGVAAVYMHEFLDGLKTAPFVGEKWAWLVEAVGKFFGKKLSPAEEKLAAAKIEAAQAKSA